MIVPTSMRASRESGFTLAELIVYLVISGVVLTSIFLLLVTQSRTFGRQQELVDAHGSLRGAASLLSYELRQSSAIDGDLYALSATAFTIRSVQGSGIICTKHATLPRYGLVNISGDVTAAASDSVVVFVAGNTSSTDDAWQVLAMSSVGAPGGMGLGNCSWTGGVAPDTGVSLVVAAPSDTAGLAVGAPLRVFRRVEYGIFDRDGRSWLGRRVAGAASWELLTGPLLSSAAGGLQFRYFDRNGNTVTDPTQVALVEVALRAQSKLRSALGDRAFVVDSLITKVAVRG